MIETIIEFKEGITPDLLIPFMACHIRAKDTDKCNVWRYCAVPLETFNKDKKKFKKLMKETVLRDFNKELNG